MLSALCRLKKRWTACDGHSVTLLANKNFIKTHAREARRRNSREEKTKKHKNSSEINSRRIYYLKNQCNNSRE